MINVQLIAEYSRVFDENEAIEDLLPGIPKTLVLQAATTFLNQDAEKNWEEEILDWFRSSNKPVIDFLFDKFHKTFLANGESPKILNPTTNLKLLQLGLEMGNDVVNQKEFEQIEIDLFKIYLLLSESWTLLRHESIEYGKINYPKNDLMVILVSMGFSASDIVNYIFKKEAYSQITKSFILFLFLKERAELQEHLNVFYKEYAIKDMKEYYEKVYPFIQRIAAKTSDGFIEITPRTDENYEEDKFILERLSVQKYSVDDDIDYRIVRSFPLIKTEEDTYRISHPLFFTDKLYKSLYFELSRINNDVKNPIKNFRSYYTSNFSEKFLFYAIIEYFISKTYIKFSGEELNLLNYEGSPDYYIRNGKYIFLFENKDILINAAIKERTLFAELDTELKKKFLGDVKTAKGVRQLANNVRKILERSNGYDDNYNEKKVIIYPVLVVHDIVFDCPGINCLMQIWFDNEMRELEGKGFIIENVKPLLLINIDTLIIASELLKSRKISLKELFEIYVDKISEKKHVTTKFLPSTKIIDSYLNREFPNHFRDNNIMTSFFKKISID